MDDAADANKRSRGGDEVAQALTVADAIGKADKCDDIALALKELDMEHYDDEDEGIFGNSYHISELVS